MLPTSHLLAFAVTSFVVIAVPGPSVMFTISRALTMGRGGALLTVVGNTAGACLQVVAVAFGIGTLVERSILAYTMIKLVGAAYLIYLGIHAIRHRHSLSEAMAPRVPARTRLRVVADGFLVGATNLKTIVFFLAALPQFVDRGASDLTTTRCVTSALDLCLERLGDQAFSEHVRTDPLRTDQVADRIAASVGLTLSPDTDSASLDRGPG